MPIETYAAQPDRSALRISRRLLAHFRILRLDHCIKQVFILPGIILAIAISGRRLDSSLLVHVVIGLVAATMI